MPDDQQDEFDAGDEVLITVTFVDKTLPNKPLTDPGDATFLLQPGYDPTDKVQLDISSLDHIGVGMYQYAYQTDSTITADLEVVAQAIATEGVIGTSKPYRFTVHPMAVPVS